MDSLCYMVIIKKILFPKKTIIKNYYLIRSLIWFVVYGMSALTHHVTTPILPPRESLHLLYPPSDCSQCWSWSSRLLGFLSLPHCRSQSTILRLLSEEKVQIRRKYENYLLPNITYLMWSRCKFTIPQKCQISNINFSVCLRVMFLAATKGDQLRDH